MTGGALAAQPLTVVVVDDSAVQRRFLRNAIEADAALSVVGEARNGREAVALVERIRPAAVLLDLDLPVMGGMEAIERIMASTPTPIVVYSSFVGDGTGANALEALAAGAVEVLAKPRPDDPAPLEAYAQVLRRTLRVAARVKVITHPRGRLRGRGLTGTAPTLDGGGGRQPLQPDRPATAVAAALPAARRAPAGDAGPPAIELEPRVGTRLIVIGASTGGPQALVSVLGALPTDLSQAVLVVQHMADGFIPGLAAWLDQSVAVPVTVAADGQRLRPGSVAIAPSGHNLLLRDARLRVQCVPPDRGQFHIPGIDHTFRSVADVIGPDAVGVLLTGMGRDGAAGLLEMRQRGAVTLGQDEASSAVYGMPAAAIALDAVDKQLALPDIGAELLRLVGRAQ